MGKESYEGKQKLKGETSCYIKQEEFFFKLLN